MILRKRGRFACNGGATRSTKLSELKPDRENQGPRNRMPGLRCAPFAARDDEFVLKYFPVGTANCKKGRGKGAPS